MTVVLDANELRATVLNIQRMSTEDGPGIRTTVFLKGCSLACHWCHNPESISPRPQVVWNDFKCIGCHSCITVCPERALTAEPEAIRRATTCRVCGGCVQECPSTAMELLGVQWALDALVREVAKDRAYFEASRGGVTVSGGEPALQVRFAEVFQQRCRDQGLHVAVDTCGQCAEAVLLRLVKHADLVLYDLKTVDSAEHERLTGQPNDRILANLQALRAHMRRSALPAELWIRTPLVPGDTATAENVRAIGEYLTRTLDGVVARWELCTFNNLCEDKYRRLGRTWRYAGRKPQSPEELARLQAIARAAVATPDIVHVPGAPRAEQ
ncbi:MAG: glycyl-radical enzyme activating protein [bacterium]